MKHPDLRVLLVLRYRSAKADRCTDWPSCNVKKGARDMVEHCDIQNAFLQTLPFMFV